MVRHTLLLISIMLDIFFCVFNVTSREIGGKIRLKKTMQCGIKERFLFHTLVFGGLSSLL